MPAEYNPEPPTPSRFKARTKDHHQKTYRTPKEATVSQLVAAENKASYTIVRTFVLGIVAGVCVAMGCHAALMASTLVGDVPAGQWSIIQPAAARRVVYGVFLPVGLLIIALMGGELFTSNCMTMTIGLCARTVPLHRYVLNLGVSMLGNFGGCCFTAALLSYWSGIFTAHPQYGVLESLVTTKTHLSFLETWTRAIGANTCVCGAILGASTADEIPGKVLVIYVVISGMAFSAYEHLILNFYQLMLGLMCGSPTTNFGHVIYKNFLPVLFGNWLAGATVGATLYFLYLHNEVIAIADIPNKLIPGLTGRKVPARDEIGDAYKWMRKRLRRSNSTGDIPQLEMDASGMSSKL